MKVLSPRAFPEAPGRQAQGDEPLESLLAQYRSLLRAAIERVCPRNLGLQVADIEQDACIRLWRALKSERRIRNPASYLYRTAATATIDAVRRVRARREEQLNDAVREGDDQVPVRFISTDRTPEDLAADSQLAAAIEAAVGRLPEKRQRAVRLHLQGFRSDEIGNLAGWTEPKARNLVSRGMADLRRELRAMGIEDGHA